MLRNEKVTVELTSQLPTLRFYREFPEEWETFPPQLRSELGKFLEALQRNPYDPELLKECETHGHYFACRITEGYAVYWKLEFDSRAPITISTWPKKICVLAVSSPDSVP